MEPSKQKNGLLNFLALLLVGLAAFGVARYCASFAGQVSVVFIGLGTLVAGVSWFQMRLEDNERLERLEFDELARSHGGSAMFESSESEVFPIRRSREQFERFFVPIFTVLLCLAQAGGAFLLWRWLPKGLGIPALNQPTTALALFAMFALVLFLLGKFSATIARIEGHRLLRPGASYLLLAAYLTFFVALGIAGVQAGFPQTDIYVAYALTGLLALISVETVIALILEMYRPRVKGKVERPLYESRLVGLLGQPEGLITTAAQALDYQFGFKVSETWFYRFFEQAIVSLLLLQFAVLLLSTCVMFIDSGEEGLLERFGKAVPGRTLLGPGAHLKLPWPIDEVRRFRTEQIQSFEVGLAPESEMKEETVVLWTVAHTKEENLLVGNRMPSLLENTNLGVNTNQITGKRTPPVSLITGSIPVQFQITDLEKWAYRNEDAPALLQDLATREIVRYLVGADMNELMSYGRSVAAETMAQRVQAAADQLNLGVKIISLGLQDLHPPVKVAPDFEKVISAVHLKEARILMARAEDIRTNTLAGGQAAVIVNRAMGERESRKMGAVAQAGLFTNQIPAYLAAPSVYAERAYLKAFTRATAGARKYVILTTNTHDVFTFDLQDKIRGDLLNELSVPTPKK